MTSPYMPGGGSDPNVGIGQMATARMQALRSRLEGMQGQDAATGSLLKNLYQKQHFQQEPQQQRSPTYSRGGGSGPPGQRPTGQLGDWISQALGVLHLGNEFAPGIANMIKHESGGNPNAINRWDSNWKAGHPSMGLMQTIQPTFQHWALPGYNQSAYDPVSNIIAGIRYAQHRYGNGMLQSGGRRNSRGGYIGY